jgi:hypothetical protein
LFSFSVDNTTCSGKSHFLRLDMAAGSLVMRLLTC